MDFEGNLEEPAVKNALRGLEAEANRMRSAWKLWTAGGINKMTRVKECVLVQRL